MPLPNRLAQYLHRRPQRIELLQHVAEQGSITRAAKAAGLSYKAAWDAIDELNNLAQHPLVERSVGGKGGGGARLSSEGERVLRLYQRLQALQAQVLELAEDEADLDLLNRLMLNTSARNQLHGRVLAIEAHGRNDRVQLDLGGGLALAAMITHGSTERLALQPGVAVVALIKAGWLALHAPGEPLAAGDNQLDGRVQAVLGDPEGPSEVRVGLANGQTLCALVPAARVVELGLREGSQVAARCGAAMVLLGTPF
ncbi:TOBE domain-containing protein [Pseudomonas sp. NPDC007930]|uniref:TOBE domain-containing protein n=1 Tax=Pseudomonas sp. NPDC007930 TaxID=3364417 RepID=UPI0036EA5A45